MSDEPLLQCPACGQQALKKQVTAAAFQLKGTGWYATDFKNSGKPTAPTATPKNETGNDSSSAAKADQASGNSSEKGASSAAGVASSSASNTASAE